MWSVCVIPGKASFTNEDDAVPAPKKMNDGHAEKDVGKEDNAEVAEANEDKDKVMEATDNKKKETVPVAEQRVVVTSPMGMALQRPVGPAKASWSPMVAVTMTKEKWTKGSPHPRPIRKWCVPTKKKA